MYLGLNARSIFVIHNVRVCIFSSLFCIFVKRREKKLLFSLRIGTFLGIKCSRFYTSKQTINKLIFVVIFVGFIADFLQKSKVLQTLFRPCFTKNCRVHRFPRDCIQTSYYPIEKDIINLYVTEKLKENITWLVALIGSKGQEK